MLTWKALEDEPMISLRFSRLVVPTIGAVIPAREKCKCRFEAARTPYVPSLDKDHAIATCAMLMHLFLEISSTLRNSIGLTTAHQLLKRRDRYLLMISLLPEPLDTSDINLYKSGAGISRVKEHPPVSLPPFALCRDFERPCKGPSSKRGPWDGPYAKHLSRS